MGKHFLNFILFFFSLVSFNHSTLSKSDKKTPKPSDTNIKSSKKSVYERKLVDDNLDIPKIIKNYNVYCKSDKCLAKHFPNDVLAYITPWNTHGFDVAKTFPKKFSYLSPVWYQILPKCKIQDGNNTKINWLKDMRKLNDKIKIVPRFLFDGWDKHLLKALFTNEKDMQNCIDILIDTLDLYEFDGVVLEIWNAETVSMKDDMIHFIHHLSTSLHLMKKEIVLVIPPPFYDEKTPGLFQRDDMDHLKSFIDRFSVMTYDYATNVRSVGPNSPYSWIKKCVEFLVDDEDVVTRRKLFIGTNFYGYDFSISEISKNDPSKHNKDIEIIKPVIAHNYIEVSKAYDPKCHWAEDWQEHICRYSKLRANVGHD